MTEPLSTKAGLDVADFVAGVRTINTSMRVLDSDFKKNAAALGDWSKTATGMEERIKFLNSAIDLQRQKLEKTQSAYQTQVKLTGENSKAAQEWQIKVNKATESLNKMEYELGENETALKDMNTGTKNTAKSVDDLGDKSRRTSGLLGTLKGAVNGVGVAVKASLGVISAVVGGLAALTTMVTGLATATVGPATDLNETISKVEVVFGDAAGAVRALGDVSAEALGMSENAALAAAGTYGNLFRSMEIGSEASAEMSVELVKLAADLASFNNMAPEEVLDKLRAGLTGETEPLKALAININAAMVSAKAMELGLYDTTQSTLELQKAQIGAEKAQNTYNDALTKYGQDSLQARDAAVKLEEAQNKLNDAATGSVEALTPAQKAQATYALIMEQSALAQGDFARTSGGAANQGRSLAAVVENLRASIGQGFLPLLESGQRALIGFLGGGFVDGAISSLTSGLGGLTGIVQPLFDALGSFDGDFGGLIEVAQGVVQNLITTLAQSAPQMMDAGLGILQMLIQGLAQSIPALVPVVLTLVESLLTFLTTSLPVLIDGGVTMLLALLMGLVQALPMLVEAALQIIISLANGLTAALPTMIPAITQAIVLIVQTLLENLPALIEAALMLIIALAEGLVAAVPVLAPAIPIIVGAIFDALIAISPMLLDAGLKFIETLVKGSLDNLPILLQSALDIGKAIVDGVWRGIQNSAAMFTANVKSFFGGIIDAAKQALGISSPSKPGIAIGKNFVGSVGMGGEAEADSMQQKMANIMGGMIRTMTGTVSTATPAFAFAGAGATGGGSISIGDIYVDARGATDPAAVGAAVGDGLVKRLRARGAL